MKILEVFTSSYDLWSLVMSIMKQLATKYIRGWVLQYHELIECKLLENSLVV